MLDCPICKNEVNQLVIPPEGKKFGCRPCVYKDRKPTKSYNVNLGQTYLSDGVTRISVGKAWEIEQRVVSPDDPKVIINRKTGRETQR